MSLIVTAWLLAGVGGCSLSAGGSACPGGEQPAATDDCTTPADEDCDGRVNNGCVYASCLDVQSQVAGAPDGPYTVDIDGAGPDTPFDVYCDMTTAGGGWTMAFKVSAGVPGEAGLIWQSAPFNDDNSAVLDLEHDDHYASRIISRYWNAGGMSITRARIHVYEGGALQKLYELDATGSDALSWLSHARLLESSYTDLAAAAPNIFGVLGDALWGRRFLLNAIYGGCPGDTGWLVLDSAPDACSWEIAMGAPPIRIIYSRLDTRVIYQTALQDGTLGMADVLVVLVR